MGAVSETTAYWLVWGVGLLTIGIGAFATRELPELIRRQGGTLSEVTERAIARYRLLWWSVLVGLSILSAGFALTGIHWYTSLL